MFIDFVQLTKFPMSIFVIVELELVLVLVINPLKLGCCSKA